MTQSEQGIVANQDLAEFVRANHAQLQKYLYWQVQSREIAEELAQETYLRYLRQAETDRVVDLNAYLFTIAANLARDHLRGVKRGQDREFVALDIDMPDSKPNTEEIIARQCLNQQLHRAIASLPALTRDVFLLYRSDRLSYKQIGELLNISERNVEYQLRQAQLLCRSFLKKT
ncbi:sigma-70 family RNA polymerase sigma factor [Methylomonas sp. UP202]|uniref:RNA polymerase sigma factor n=1 Tax=Methylomonas sp. UP202 TaxID=3040943 RepID=UPI0024796499|nr:sigma-70 family RNA polymerase sigma factor [Methylomonas sp. UP202]WGS84774.1 sigma-70 family RNA polymerase sigma factor [Methylomonas sp. UP202]